MFRNVLLASTLAALAATTAIAKVEKVTEVEVTTDVAAIGNEKAALYWGNLSVDLKEAILLRLVDKTGEDGAKVTVDIREAELANTFERAFNLADAVLSGQVNVSDPTNANAFAFQIAVSLEGMRVLAADGTPIVFSTIDTPEAYRALVDGFADGVVKALN